VDINGASGLQLIAYSGIEEIFIISNQSQEEFYFPRGNNCGKLDLVKILLEKQNNLLNLHSNDGFTPLSLAAYFNQSEIFIFLLENGASPNLQATNASRVNALHSVIAKDNLELCKLLFQHGADPNIPQIQNVTALHSATHRGNIDLVKLLVSNGANINSKMDNGDTAYSIAVKEKRADIIKYLEALSK
jgi:FOG: Ankyrin repeat